MKNLLSLIVIFLVSATFLHAQSGIEGTWNASIQSPNGTMDITYNFDVDGDTLTGTVGSPMGETEILNGKVNGDTFSFETSFNNMKISHECELADENTIAMQFTMAGMGMGPQPLTLTRASTE